MDLVALWVPAQQGFDTARNCRMSAIMAESAGISQKVALSSCDTIKSGIVDRHIRYVKDHVEEATHAVKFKVSPPRSTKHRHLAITPKDATEIVHMYESGMTTAQFGQKLGCCRQKIAACLHSQGIILRTDADDPKTRKRVCTLYKLIGTYKGTAREICISPATVKKIILRYMHN